MSSTSVSFWSCCCQIVISGQASTSAAIRPRCCELAGLLMTHPLRLTPEEAVKAVMWILMCSNDLLFVLGASYSLRPSAVALVLGSQCLLPATSPVEVAMLMRMVMLLTTFQSDMLLHDNASTNLVTSFINTFAWSCRVWLYRGLTDAVQVHSFRCLTTTALYCMYVCMWVLMYYIFSTNYWACVFETAAFLSLSPAEINGIQISAGQRETCDYYQ